MAATDWRGSHAPAANTRATFTQAAPGAGYRNVLTGFTVILAAGATAPVAATVTVAVIDGVSGATSYIDGPHAMSIPAIAGAMSGVTRSGLDKRGSANTATTIEFSAAGGANTLESVSIEGTVVRSVES